MIKLNDILSIMDPTQYVRIYVGDSEWTSMTAYAALEVIQWTHILSIILHF